MLACCFKRASQRAHQDPGVCGSKHHQQEADEEMGLGNHARLLLTLLECLTLGLLDTRDLLALDDLKLLVLLVRPHAGTDQENDNNSH